jgi:hypothetical protein
MSADPNKKSPRTFQCRDVLWETFEQMSRELECSVDYLINEGMKQYARQRGHGAQRTPYPSGRLPESVGPAPGPASPARTATARATPSPEAAPRPLPPPSIRPPAVPAPPARAGLPAPPVGARSAMPAVPGSRIVPPPPLPNASRGASPGGAANGLPRMPAEGATLTLVYQGEPHPITKDRFVIGRGKQSSDLTLRDPNVSRQHALIEYQDGAYFIVDMGSTNGVTYRGQRVARKPIGDGDVFHICDHELLFTYR